MGWNMEAWRRAFRHGFAPGLSTAALQSLLVACRNDDKRLMQRMTVPVTARPDSPCDRGCAVAFCGLTDSPERSTFAIERFFAESCHAADERLHGPRWRGATHARDFLNWFDDTPRTVALERLAAEIDYVLSTRGVQ